MKTEKLNPVPNRFDEFTTNEYAKIYNEARKLPYPDGQSVNQFPRPFYLGFTEGVKFMKLKNNHMTPTESKEQQAKVDCTLTNEELIVACHKIISENCQGRDKWRMTVPPDMDRDSDMLIAELSNRFRDFIAEQAKVERLIEAAKEVAEDFARYVAFDNHRELENLREALAALEPEKEKDREAFFDHGAYSGTEAKEETQEELWNEFFKSQDEGNYSSKFTIHRKMK